MAIKINSSTVIDDSKNLTGNDISITSPTGYIEILDRSPLFGTVAGYTSGGGPTSGVIVDKFPFATDANATNVGNLTQARLATPAGQSSTVSGYTSGGGSGDLGSTALNTIDRFPFAVNANASDVGDLTQARSYLNGQSSAVSGYTSGGTSGNFSTPGLELNTIDKFPFATDANASDVGDLTQNREGSAGQSSSINGYISGGQTFGVQIRATVDKFPFATNANATNVGNLTVGRYWLAAQSSTVSGYTSGGITTTNTIDKFPFSTDANATDVGDLTVARRDLTGQSSRVSGYASGGGPPGPSNTVDKFPFATDANATDVGDLTQARRFSAGQQD